MRVTRPATKAMIPPISTILPVVVKNSKLVALR